MRREGAERPMTPALIAWEDVPEKDRVWVREKGTEDWWAERKDRVLDHIPFGNYGKFPHDYEFARAEQQPGELADGCAHCVTRSHEYHARTLELQQAEADLSRLREGLAALEQDMRDLRLLGTEQFIDRLAALREGR